MSMYRHGRPGLNRLGARDAFPWAWEPSRRGGAPPPWNPLDIPGCVLWFDASRIIGLSDGDPVSTWPDLAGGHDATGAGATRPTYRTGIINGLPGVRGDGADILNTGNLGHDIGTIFAVLGNIALAGYNGWGYFSNPGKRFMLMNNSVTVFYAGDANDLYLAPLDYYVDGLHTSDMGDAGYHVVTLVGSSAVNCPGTLSLMHSVINGGMPGDAGAFVFYDTVLGAVDRAAAQAGLKAQWGTP